MCGEGRVRRQSVRRLGAEKVKRPRTVRGDRLYRFRIFGRLCRCLRMDRKRKNRLCLSATVLADKSFLGAVLRSCRLVERCLRRIRGHIIYRYRRVSRRGRAGAYSSPDEIASQVAYVNGKEKLQRRCVFLVSQFEKELCGCSGVRVSAAYEDFAGG